MDHRERPGPVQAGALDLLLLANLALWAQQAGTGREAAAFEIYLSRTAQRLDPAVSQRLPDQVLVGSQMVPSSLTPMQRVAYYLCGPRRTGRGATATARASS